MRRRKKLTAMALVVACAMTLAVSAAAEGGDWPRYRGRGGDGVSLESGLSKNWPEGGPPEMWRVRLGEGYSGIAAVGERVYTLFSSAGDEYAAAFDAATGDEAWRFRLDKNRRDAQGGGPRATPAVDGGLVFALGARGKLVALSAGTGEVAWQHDLRSEYGAAIPRYGVSTSPLVEGDLLLLDVGGKTGHSLMAFEKEGGQVAWAAHTESPGYSSPLAVTVHGVRQILFFTVSGLISVSPADGSLYWQVPWKTRFDINAAMPVFLPPDRVFISSSYDVGGAVYEIDRDDGGFSASEIWRSRVMKNHFNSSVLHDGHLYGFDNGTLKCIEARSGDEKWRQRGFAKGSLIVANGHLVVLSEGGRLALAEATPEAYREKGSAQPLEGKCWTMPTLSRGRLFLRNQKEMVALDLREGNGGQEQ